MKDNDDKQHIPEHFINSMKECLIPGNELNDTLNIDNCDDKLLIFSFIIKSKSNIKCHLIYNGQILRFKGEYIRDLLPLLFIDNDKIHNYDIKYLRKNIGYVSQLPLLFAESIRDNIKGGNPNITDDDISFGIL